MRLWNFKVMNPVAVKINVMPQNARRASTRSKKDSTFCSGIEGGWRRTFVETVARGRSVSVAGAMQYIVFIS